MHEWSNHPSGEHTGRIIPLGMLRLARGGALLGGAAGVVYAVKARKERLPDKFVLELDFSTVALVEKSPKWKDAAVAKVTGAEKDTMLLRDATAAIRAASDDPRVSGLVAHLGNPDGLSLATTQELSAAVQEFRKRKASAPTFAYAAEYQDTIQYVLASSFGAVYQQPGVTLRLPSLSVEMPYFAGFLRKWGLRFEAVTQGAYKSGFAPLSDYSASRNQLQQARSLLASSYAQVIRAIAAGRGLSEKQLRKLCRRGGMLGSAEAQKLKLLDGVAYADELDELIKSACETEDRRDMACPFEPLGLPCLSLAYALEALSPWLLSFLMRSNRAPGGALRLAG